MKIIFATNNHNKLKEAKYFFRNLNIEILSLKDIGYKKKIIESGITFYDNAKIKANTIFKKNNIPTFADDSGLCIDILYGYPGVYSSRFLENKSQKTKNSFILKILKNVKENKRKAHYTCCLYFIKNENENFFIKKNCNGRIAKQISGNNGFGFDPIFYLDYYKKTMSEISIEQKNKISHRAKAFICLKKILLTLI